MTEPSKLVEKLLGGQMLPKTVSGASIVVSSVESWLLGAYKGVFPCNLVGSKVIPVFQSSLVQCLQTPKWVREKMQKLCWLDSNSDCDWKSSALLTV